MAGSRIRFLESSIADIPTPPAGKASMFLDQADGAMKVKKSDGSIVLLEAFSENTVDIIAAALTAGTGILISFDDPNDTITISVDPSEYYSQTQLDNGQLDSRYYTEVEVDALLLALQTQITDLDNNKLSRDGSQAMTGSLDMGSNDITSVGTVDGRDLSVDGTKLDGIEPNAKDDQLASEVPVTPAGNLISTNVQDALVELQSDIDGISLGGAEVAQDAIASAISAGTQDGVSVTYDDAANSLSFENTDTGSDAVTAHEAAVDPHPQYETAAEAQAKVNAHANLINNPHGVTATQVGLGNVDNTSDLDKPISTATQDALDLKYDASNPNNYIDSAGAPVQPSDIADFETTTELNARDVANRNRANHTGTQLSTTISDFDTAVASNTAVAANTAKVSADGSVTTHNDVTDAGSGAIVTVAERNKLAGIEAGATADQNASEVPVTPSGNLAATDVQAALTELQGDVDSINAAAVTNHSQLILDDGTNPHGTTAADVGLGNVDNTSDLDKPISTATQDALDLKYDASNPNNYIDASGAPVQPSDIADFETTTQLNARDTANRSRSNHTGTQLASTISDFATAVQASETLTTLSTNANILTYVDEAGNSTQIDLSLYLDDTNLARIVSGTLDPVTGIATFTRDDNTTFTVDFSALNDQAAINQAIVDLKAEADPFPQYPLDSEVVKETFETVSKNLKTFDYTLNYTGSNLTSIVYTDGVSSVTKTLNYTGGLLTSIVLSGDTPLGIGLTKTLTYTGSTLTGVSYS